MKIINNILSKETFFEAIKELHENLNERKWSSSLFMWDESIHNGIKGSCMSSLVSPELCKKIEKDIKKHIPNNYSGLYMQFHVFQYYSGVAAHDDGTRTFGATIYLNKDWDVNWGGIFLWKENEKDEILKGVLPKPNMMVLNDETQIHMVTPISPDCKEPRISIQIWGME
jgi:Rps23 Pro-64 3,4-dihydroxylase Tpa1-like proline 4-hydroxylase